MNQLLSLPDWAPPWLGPVLMILGALFALAFLIMPFSVFSLKSRLDQIEIKLEDMHAALRSLQVDRPVRSRMFEEPSDKYPVRPPIAPAPQMERAPPPRAPVREQRAEPKLNWPR